MRTTLIIFLFLTSMFSFYSCEKSLTKKHKGDYYFTIQASSYQGFIYNDSTITFYGTINDESKTTISIIYGPVLTNSTFSSTYVAITVLGKVEANVDSDGNLTDSDRSSHSHYYGFTGKFDGNGNVDFTVQVHGLGGGFKNVVHGSKY